MGYEKLDDIGRVTPHLEMQAYKAVQQALTDEDDDLMQRAEIVRLALAIADGIVNYHHGTVQPDTDALVEMVNNFYRVESP